jgi:hypothetical protein
MTEIIVIEQPVVNISIGETAVTVITKETEVILVEVGISGINGASGDASYRHTQTTPATTWTINHNLGKYPSIELLTVGSVKFFAEITHPNSNQSIISLAIATAGIAQCN